MNTETTKPHITSQAMTINSEAAAFLKELNSEKGLIITNDKQYESVGAKLVAISTRIRELENIKKTATDPMSAALKSVREWFKGPEETLKSIKGHLNAAVSNYDEIQKEKVRIENARLRKIAEEEQKKKMADAKKLADEAAAKRQKTIDEAAELRESGDEETAQAVEEHGAEQAADLDAESQTLEVMAEALDNPIAVMEPPKLNKVKFRETWSADVVDVVELCRAVGAGEVDVEAVLPAMPYLNGLARAMKAKLRVPGVEPVMKKTPVS